MTSPYSPFNRFHHVVVAVADPRVAATDWSRLFGTPVLTDDRVAVGDGWIEFTAASGGRTGVVRVGVEVDEVDTVAHHAAAAGARVRADGGRFVVELSGVEVELCERGQLLEPPGMVFTRFHHVVVAVVDDDAAIQEWDRVFGFRPAPEGPGGTLVAHHVPVGEAWFGLTSSGTDAGAITAFIERRGQGVYALALVVHDRDGFADSVRGAGGRVLGEAADPQRFVHPAATHGVLLELASEWPDRR